MYTPYNTFSWGWWCIDASHKHTAVQYTHMGQSKLYSLWHKCKRYVHAARYVDGAKHIVQDGDIHKSKRYVHIVQSKHKQTSYIGRWHINARGMFSWTQLAHEANILYASDLFFKVLVFL